MTEQRSAAVAESSAPDDPALDRGRTSQLVEAVAARVTELCAAGALDLPLPGGGRTAERFRALAELAGEDLCVGRLAEGHVDALAILAELGGPEPAAGQFWGVWAAHPPGASLVAERGRNGWWLNGLKRYCSGASSCTHALVTAETAEGRRLFAVRLNDRAAVPVADSWQALGMAGSDTPDVHFTEMPGTAIGPVGAYTERPGFLHGGLGVAACWLGGARAVANAFGDPAQLESLDPHAAAHRGSVDLLLHAADVVLERAAEAIDADPLDLHGDAQVRGLRARGLVERTCREVLDRVGRATGAGPLCHDAHHARMVADLTVYIRQHHAERDLATLGRTVHRAGGVR